VPLRISSGICRSWRESLMVWSGNSSRWRSSAVLRKGSVVRSCWLKSGSGSGVAAVKESQPCRARSSCSVTLGDVESMRIHDCHGRPWQPVAYGGLRGTEPISISRVTGVRQGCSVLIVLANELDILWRGYVDKDADQLGHHFPGQSTVGELVGFQRYISIAIEVSS